MKLRTRPLTARQRQVYLLLLRGLLQEQRFPTWREILGSLGIDPEPNLNAVAQHLAALEHHGLVTCLPSGRVRLEGVRLVAAFEDNEAGQRARAVWEAGASAGSDR